MGGILGHQTTMVSDEVKFFVDNVISSKPVVVFSKTYCPYCTKAKTALNHNSVNPAKIEILEIEKRPDCSEIQTYLKELTGASSVPRVFIGGKFIGGGDDTERLDRNGELKGLLQAAGALD